MQTDLRLILVIIGVCVVAGIIWDAFKRSRAKKPLSTHDFEDTVMTAPGEEDRPDFSFDADPLFDDGLDDKELPLPKLEPQVQAEIQVDPLEITDDIEPVIERPAPEEVPYTSNTPQEIIAFTIMSKQRQGFTGRSVESALQATRFKYGPRQIYHRYEDDKDTNTILYSVASIVEPGTLELNVVGVNSVPGLMMFMVVPNNFDSSEVFNDMLVSAKNLTNMLNGELCDSQRCNLTPQMVEHYREKIQEIQRRELAYRQTGEL